MRTLLRRKKAVGVAGVFLPRAGPFASLAPKLASSVPNRTISANVTLASTRRTTPLEYNTLTITAGVLTTSFADMCVFIRCNIFNFIGGTINVDGEAGYITGSGGRGSGGGGGGGGQATAGDPCDIFVGGAGGIGTSGSAGQDGTGSVGNPGGGGVGLNNWGPVSLGGSDTYDYVTDLGGNFVAHAAPYLDAGTGGYGGWTPCCCGLSYQGGNAGGSAGLVVIAANQITGTGGATRVSAIGGGAEQSGDGNVTAQGGSGGGVLFYTKAYSSNFLNGNIKVQADPFGPFNGSAQIFKVDANDTTTLQSFATAF
jgi:hypothetical protein